MPPSPIPSLLSTPLSSLLDGTPTAPRPASPAAGQTRDDDVEEADDGADDGLQDGADAVDDGHQAGADGAEDGFDLRGGVLVRGKEGGG